ncbi:The fantastic four family [Parasponia andersonii]|uniref:The fantastic four family n=1 Tax=Parasponia andersonii TaxID=3476 RepID=A0A2P5CWL5_PARAD|nr:The fantastic four family [Parasponia andersonii]
MAACGSLQHIFENPLQENPTLLDSLSPWNQIKPVKKSNIDQSSFTEIFGELHFKESNSLFSSSSSSSSVIDLDSESRTTENTSEEKKRNPPLEHSFSSSKYTGCHKKSDSFSLKSLESLQLCTEGLGFESSDEVDDLMLKNSIKEEDKDRQKPVEKDSLSVAKKTNSTNFCGEIVRKSRTTTATTSGGGRFPPPISCLSKSSGKPWVCFKSYRQDGRFVLKEVRVQRQEFLHACREDGRLKLHFVQPNHGILEDDDDMMEDDESEEAGADYDDEDDDENGRSGLSQNN